MSSEESNKMSKKTPSQDSNSEIEWDLEELKKAIVTSAEDHWEAFLDSAGQVDAGEASGDMLWAAEKKKFKK